MWFLTIIYLFETSLFLPNTLSVLVLVIYNIPYRDLSWLRLFTTYLIETCLGYGYLPHTLSRPVLVRLFTTYLIETCLGSIIYHIPYRDLS